MSVAIRTATRIRDQDDFGSTPGAGNDGYALTWDNGAGEFVLAAAGGGVTDHGALTGLSDDDHSQYALLAGRSGGQTFYGGKDANDDITIHGTSDATRTSSYVILQPIAGNVGIGISAPLNKLHLYTSTIADGICLDGNLNPAIVLRVSGVIKGYAPVVISTAGSFFNDSQVGDMGFRSESNRVLFGVGVTTSTMQVSNGAIGIAGTVTAKITDAVTNAVTNVVTIGHDTSGTAAAGFGNGLVFNLQSSTTASQSAALMTASWIVATHASRTARLALSAYDYNGAREGVRIDTDGSAALLGFYGHAAVAQQVLATGAGASVDNVITALQALGLVKQS